MSNPMTPNPASNVPPPSGGGIPKWVVILIVVLLVIIVGCCGGIATCYHFARPAAQKLLDQAKQAAQDTEHQEEQEMAKRSEGGAAEPAQSTGGTSAGGSANAGGSSNTENSITAGLGVGKLPSNFPSDIPVMGGLTPTGMSAADRIKGSGMVMLGGKVKREDVVAYYDKQMTKNGWKEETNQDIMNQTIMKFTKDGMTTSVQVIQDNDPNSSAVTIVYGKS